MANSGNSDGKTKSIIVMPSNPSVAVMKAKDIVSWKNKHQQIMKGKAVWSTTITANMFQILDHCHVPNAFIEQIGPDELLVDVCDMIPFEVVIRFGIEEVSSVRKRNPKMATGPLPVPMVEFFLKTKGTVFKGITVPDDDPYVSSWDDTGVWVHHASSPVVGKGVFIPVSLLLDTDTHPGCTLSTLLESMQHMMLDAGIALREEWSALDWDLGDFKAEFGWRLDDRLIIADVIDNDSWRLKDPNGIERSKQTIRDGKSIKAAAKDFKLVADVSNQVRELALVA